MAPAALPRRDRRARRVPGRSLADAHLTLAIDARGWGWRHPGRRAWAVRGVDLAVREGERVLLLGASGSGKSTLLLALAGLLGGGEREGELRVLGREPAEAREGTALVLQDPAAQIVMARCGDEVAFGLAERCVPRGEIAARVAAALDAAGLPGPDHPTDALSGGEQQRLALAAARALDPRLLLLDEPTAHLDPGAAAAFRARVARAARDRTLVLVEHRVEESLAFVDRVVVLGGERGILADGAPAAVFARDGDRLAREGVWVPGHPVAARRAPSGPGAPVIVARGLGYAYPGGARDALVSADVSLREGDALALVGANGAGKSTLALLLGGLLAPTRGTAELAAAPARERRLARIPAPDLVRHVGSVFQEPEASFVCARVDDEVALGPRRAGMGEARARARAAELLERLDLARLAAANPFTLSGGEKRRLSVGAALATSPRALVLDEPTFGQDRRGHEELVALLAGFRDAGGAVCAATHDLAFAGAFADRTAEVRAGRAAA